MAFVKWIGGALGFAMGGPIGALMGFAFGSMFDGAEEDPSQRRINPNKEISQLVYLFFQLR
jgi:hypothetical protein